MQKLEWTTVQRRIADLIPQFINPRKISDKQMSDLKKSLKKYNLVEIPVVDLDDKILAGHQRIFALKILGRGDEQIDVRIPNRRLTDKESKQYLIASNQLGGDWDYDLLKHFDIEILTEAGFDDMELVSFWDKDNESVDDDFDVDKEIKKIHNPVTELGDLIIMGKHKLLCASATDSKAVQKLFQDDKASMYYSDSPFNIGLNYDKGVGNKSNYGGNVDDSKTPDAYKEFINQTLQSALPVLTEDTHIFMWCDEAWVWIFQTLYMELGIKNRRLNIWLKNNASPTPQVAFNKVVEYCCYGTIGSPFLSTKVQNLNEIQNKEAGTGNNLFDYVTNVWATKRLAGSKYDHPTEKNPDLHEKAILRCTKPGDIIFDSFSGSGSTMICAEQLGRRVYATEISEVFCDLAIRRYEKLTGKKAKVIKNYYEEK
jgi:DNA modification methylase